MNIIILMAGEGRRFTDAGIVTPKPLVEVNERTILEWTTRSLPFIQHADQTLDIPIYSDQLYFAVREEHEEYGVSEYLQKVYGSDINIISFKKTTRGNLETAYYVGALMDRDEDPLLVLDSDNKYNDNGLLKTLAEAYELNDSMVVTCFDPVDRNDKWAFAVTEGNIVTEIAEKDGTALDRGGRPMVGTFWFHSADQFMNHADRILRSGERSGWAGREEFFISQVPKSHMKQNRPVFAHAVTDVIPLGTPEDVERFRV
jgi:NDP-sugar pyrophosphorylase family protein